MVRARASNRFRLRQLLDNGQHYKRCISTHATDYRRQEIVPQYFSQGPLSWFKGSYAKRFPSLDDPLAGLKLPLSLPDYVEPQPTKITTLPNGLKIASENCPGPAACIGLFVDCGSIYESERYVGVTHLLERMAFKSTKNRSHLRIVREIEGVGGNVSASASREQMGYTYDVLKTYLPQAVELLVDCVRNPMFHDNEVKQQLARVKTEIGEISNNPQHFLLELLHPTAYSGPLGQPLMAPEMVLDRIDGSTIEEFFYENYTAERMVLAASGVDHEQLLTIAEPLLYDLPRGPSVEVPKSIYVGGEFRLKADPQKTHVALAFEVPGGWRQEKDATVLTVLQTLMGGGNSFSAGGPGKGMHSRLYLRVLNEYQKIQSFSAFSSLYNDTGLFGIQLSTGPDFLTEAIKIAADEFQAIATPGEVTAVELNRAKNATKSAILMNLESRMIVTEDIGRQILTYGCRKPVEHFLRAIDELTLDDLAKTAQKILDSPLTVASMGDVDCVPGYDLLRRDFCDGISLQHFLENSLSFLQPWNWHTVSP